MTIRMNNQNVKKSDSSMLNISTTTGYSPNALYTSYFDEYPSSYWISVAEKGKTVLSRLTNFDEIISFLKADHIIQLGGYSKPDITQLKQYPEVENHKDYTYAIAFYYSEKKYMILLDIREECIVFYYNKEIFSDFTYFQTISEKIKGYLYYAISDPKEADIKLVYFDMKNGFQTIKSKINITTINLAENYNDDIIEVNTKLIDFLKSRDTGLCLFRGEPGTGKSYFLRHLLTSYPNNYIFIPNNVTSHLSSPDFLSFMMENKDSIFILEDCEQVLFNRELNPHNTGISGILNIADGLMSDVLNIKFICTFNTDINNIDKALLREGRCIINYEFKPLTIEKTKFLLNKLGKETDNCCEMTLAQIYNYKDQIVSKPTKKKIGF